MKRHFTILFWLISINLLWSQKILLQWEGSTVLDFGLDNKITVPFFKNSGFSFDQNSIFINAKQKINEKNLVIRNFVWKNIQRKDLYDLDINLLPQNESSGISYYFNDKENAEYAQIRIATIISDHGVAKRLVSFDVVESAAELVKNSQSVEKVGTTVNPLSSGNFYKIKVDKSGVFKITTQFLKDIGINPASVNPKNFRIYGNGGIMLPEYNQDTKYSALQEDAIMVVGESDGVWNDGDYALFYAQGPNGYNLYDFSNGKGYKRKEYRNDQCNNIINIYDDYSYYFLTFDKGIGKRVQPVDVALTSTPTINRYDDYQVINDEKYNLLNLGRTWTGDAFNSNKTISFTTKSPILPEDNVRFRTQVIAYKAQGNNIDFNINNLNPTSVQIFGNAIDYIPVRYYGSINNLQGNNITINYIPNNSANPNGAFYFDYIEVQYKENLTFNGNQMNFRYYDVISGSGQTYNFSVDNAGSIEQIWDVSDVTNANARVNKNSGNKFDFAYVADNLNFNNEFVAFRSDAAFTPSYVGKVENQNLSGLQNVDYLVITTPEFFGYANKIANHHHTKNNLNTQIVDVNKIYNEFSSGGKDITAIRDFITKLNTPAGNLKYVLLLGDTTYDYKNRTPNNFNIVPSYESEESGNYTSSFVTDDYFVMTAAQTNPYLSNNLPNVPIGRLPAANSTEANLLINKTLAYYNNLPGQSTPFGEWRMKMDFVVDIANEGGTPFHNLINNYSIVPIFEGTTDKPEYNIRKLYLDAYQGVVTAGGVRYPQVNQAISNDVGNSLYLFYFGHGGINGWAQSRVLGSTEVQNFNNFNSIYTRFPFCSTITCEFCLWDEPNTFSVGEQFIKHSDGGAATMITSSRAIDVSYGIDFTPFFTKNLLNLNNDDFETLGNAHLKAKQQFNLVNNGGLNHLKVNFLGDPAMKLSRPKRLLVIDNINTPVPNLIRALDFVKITGHINNSNGSLNSSFNGRVVVNIFDKRLNKHTLTLPPQLNYTEEGGAIVKASGKVINGVFTVEFYVPKDINYQIGTGRILVYADNKVFDVFNNQTIQIGDINPNGINDNEPPKVKLYMNNTNFANGGITNQNPMLLACITDDTGINSTGSGIGHDITIILDGQIINTIVANDFFAPGEGNGCINANLTDYQKGNVTYPFRNLTPGLHQLIFKVWDINNNSTTATLNFIVKDETDETLIVNRLLNWPNPFTDKTYIQFEHNCDDILDVNVQIYTITGKLVRTFSQSVSAEPYLQGYRTPRQAIEWDGKDDFGDSVAKGTYIFKIFAKSQNQEKCKGGATAVEKMVLLK